MLQPLENPHTAYLYPTLLCNLSCEMCYSGSHHSKQKIKKEMSLDEYRRVIPELYQVGVRTFDISGGEPFLRKDIWEILKIIKSFQDTKTLLVNNGTRLRAVMAELQQHLNLIDKIYVSIDSPVPEEHNEIRGNSRAFQETLAGLAELRSRDFKSLGFNMVVMDKNRHRVRQFLDLAVANEIKYVNLLRLIDVKSGGTVPEDTPSELGMDQAYLDTYQWLEEYALSSSAKPFEITIVLPGCFYVSYQKSPRRRTWPAGIQLKVEFDPIRGCPAFGNSIIVGGTGEVTGCTAFVTQATFQTGNVKKQSVEETLVPWQEQRRNIRKREEYLKNLEPCQDCEYWQVCRGGCPATANKYYGTMMQSDPTCIKALQNGTTRSLLENMEESL
ncbi:radical SAM protein [Paenibacillus sp. NPDC057934]|uniref:radical SAM protein n=1 Tax=Paenibacillus sp. NPDC057934 TaxID=3346282 RepID=UPI0036DD9BFD